VINVHPTAKFGLTQTSSVDRDTVRFVGHKTIRFLLLIAFFIFGNGHLSHATAFTSMEVLNYKACFDGVPLREQPNEFAPRTTSIPEGILVKVDIQRGDWLRVIYKVPEGYFIGWSLATMMCRLD
jgi:hypothetical protein